MGGKLWTREQVAERILNGDTLVVYRGTLLSIPRSWLDSHPGGALAILHFVGRDASDEVDAFHPESALRKLRGYAVGQVEVGDEGWVPLVPPVMSGWVRTIGADGQRAWHNEAQAVRSAEDTELSPSSQILLVAKQDSTSAAGTPTLDTLAPPPSALSLKIQAEHSAAYKDLHREVTEAGLYKTPYLTGYGPEVARYLLFSILSVVAYRHGWFIPSAVFLGMLWHQLVFTVHDLGHMGVTHNWAIDRLVAIIIADFIGGLSIGWWVDNHNIHHLVTNHPSHDPDIEHLPFFAISPAFMSSLWSSYYKRIIHYDRAAQLFTSVQHHLFYVVMALARLNLNRLSYTFLLKRSFAPKRAKGAVWSHWLEVVGVICFWCWYIPVLRGTGSWQMGLAYFLISNIVPSPLHVQIVLSHFSRSTADLGPNESFPHRQLRTTTDVICPDSLQFLHGGLHLQVTHHLFPRLPRHNLRAASKLVKRFAAVRGLEYAEFGFVEGNQEVHGVLRAVAEQVRIVGMVANAEVHEAVEKTSPLKKEL